LALLQEEAMLDSYGKELKKQDYISSSRKHSAEGSKPAVILLNSAVRIMTPLVDERKLNELNKPRTTDDKLSVSQMWSLTHKCPTYVAHHAMEEVWQLLAENNANNQVPVSDDNDSGDDLMALSVQAMEGTEGARTIRFRGFIAGQEVFMLVDSGCSSCFIN